jgi:hypothetical protein
MRQVTLAGSNRLKRSITIPRTDLDKLSAPWFHDHEQVARRRAVGPKS